MEPLEIGSLVEVGRWLATQDYAFVTPTPETLRRNNARTPPVSGGTLRDIFGFSRGFAREALPASIVAALERGELIDALPDGQLRSRVRFSTLGDRLYAHSAYPTDAADSVFFGPDTYRFARFIESVVARMEASKPARIVDIGAGSGAGGLYAVQCRGCDDDRLVLADVNARALRFAAANATLQERAHVERVDSDVFANVDGRFDLIVTNPPYMADPQHRAYRDGGGAHGEALSLRILRESLERLAPGGWLALYTGAAVVRGVDVFQAAAEPLLVASGVHWSYSELDPDVFGEELDTSGYAAVERIAAVGLVARAKDQDANDERDFPQHDAFR